MKIMFPSDTASFEYLDDLLELKKFEVHIELNQIYSKLDKIQSPLFENIIKNTSSILDELKIEIYF